jgi:cytochrome P450
MNRLPDALEPSPVASVSVAPGPRGNLLLGSMLDMQRMDMLQFYAQNWRQYGDVVRFRMGPLVQFLVVQPEHIKHILATNNDNYTKGIGMTKLKILLGNGLFTSEGDFWRRQRRIMQPTFTHKGVVRLANDMSTITKTMLDEWNTPAEQGEHVDVSFEMMRLALNMIAKTTLDIDANQMAATTYQAFTDALEFIITRTITIVDAPLFVPTAQNRRFKRAISTLDNIIYGIIAKRRLQGDNTGDMLSLLLQARDEETGEAMTEQQLRDEVMTIFFAGHETTALTLTWVWYLLSEHPEVEAKLHAELDGVLGGRTPTLEDVTNLAYTRMVVEEAMRLYPPAAMFVRDATGNDALGPYHVPKRSMMVLSPYITHRHPALWNNPEAFDPERFAPEPLKQRHLYAYFPFGAGPRKCIGNHFAMLESQLVLAMVAQRFRLRMVRGQAVKPHFGGTLRPANNLLMRLERR